MNFKWNCGKCGKEISVETDGNDKVKKRDMLCWDCTTKIIGGIDIATAVAALQFFNFHYTASAEL